MSFKSLYLKSPDCTSLLPELSNETKARFCELHLMKELERWKQPTPIAHVQISKKLLKKAFHFFFKVIPIPNAGWAVGQKIDISHLLAFPHMDLDTLQVIVECCEFQFEQSGWDHAIQKFGYDKPEFLAVLSICLDKHQKYDFIKEVLKHGMTTAAVIMSDEDHIQQEGLLAKLDLNSTNMKKVACFCTPVVLSTLFKCVLTCQLSHDCKKELLDIIIKEERSPSHINLAEFLEGRSKHSKFLVQNIEYLQYLLSIGVDIPSGSQGPIATVLQWPTIADKDLSPHTASVIISLLQHQGLVSDLTDECGGTPVHVAVTLALHSGEIVVMLYINVSRLHDVKWYNILYYWLFVQILQKLFKLFAICTSMINPRIQILPTSGKKLLYIWQLRLMKAVSVKTFVTL